MKRIEVAIGATAAVVVLMAGCTDNADPGRERSTTTPAPSEASAEGSEISPPATSVSPSDPAKRWRDAVRRIGSRIGLSDLNAPELDYQAARMTAKWRSHGVLVNFYTSPAQQTPGRRVGSLRWEDSVAPIIRAPSGPNLAVLDCRDGRWFELAVLDTPTFARDSQLLRSETAELAVALLAAAGCET